MVLWNALPMIRSISSDPRALAKRMRLDVEESNAARIAGL